jgi:hypothetical protein
MLLTPHRVQIYLKNLGPLIPLHTNNYSFHRDKHISKSGANPTTFELTATTPAFLRQ